jgi:hypothetical protein
MCQMRVNTMTPFFDFKIFASSRGRPSPLDLSQG